MPNNTSLLNNLAYILLENDQRLAEALEMAKKASEAAPAEPSIMDTYALALYKNGKYAEADQTLQAALQKYERDKMSAPAEVYEHVGMVKEQLGAIPEATAAYKQALEAGKDALSEVSAIRINAALERLAKKQKAAEEAPQAEQ